MDINKLLTKEEVKDYWCRKQYIARQKMLARKTKDAILIECVSQGSYKWMSARV